MDDFSVETALKEIYTDNNQEIPEKYSILLQEIDQGIAKQTDINRLRLAYRYFKTKLES